MENGIDIVVVPIGSVTPLALKLWLTARDTSITLRRTIAVIAAIPLKDADC